MAGIKTATCHQGNDLKLLKEGNNKIQVVPKAQLESPGKTDITTP